MQNTDYTNISYFFSNNSYYGLLQDVNSLKRYLRRKFAYLLSMRVYSNFLKKQKKITLLRSPFVHKVAQEQFVINCYSKKVAFSLFNIPISGMLFVWIFLTIRLFLKLCGSLQKINYIFTYNNKKKIVSNKLNVCCRLTVSHKVVLQNSIFFF